MDRLQLARHERPSYTARLSGIALAMLLRASVAHAQVGITTTDVFDTRTGATFGMVAIDRTEDRKCSPPFFAPDRYVHFAQVHLAGATYRAYFIAGDKAGLGFTLRTANVDLPDKAKYSLDIVIIPGT